jgi:uncharacterized protein (TIGR02996 family)
MNSEKAFLAAIQANPTDNTTRLVYADWLQEKNDARHEYIRLQIQLQNPTLRGTKRGQAKKRFNQLAELVKFDWLGKVFPVPKLVIKGYKRTRKPIQEPITKFGGQPNWITQPQWPMSKSWKGREMQFICQIALPEFLGIENAKMAYLFITHQATDERGGDNWFFDPDANDPNKGENAVILQPGGSCSVKTKPLTTGPTVYLDDGSPAEFRVDLKSDLDPPYLPFGTESSEKEYDHYFDQIWGEKIGGTPTYGNGTLHQIEKLAQDPEWKFLLEFGTRGSDPFEINLEVDTGYMFVSVDGKKGCFMTE